MTVPRFFKGRTFDSASSSRILLRDPTEFNTLPGTSYADRYTRTITIAELRTQTYEVRQIIVRVDAKTSVAGGSEQIRITVNGAAQADEPDMDTTSRTFEFSFPVNGASSSVAVAIQSKGVGGTTHTFLNIEIEALVSAVTI